MRKIEQIVLCVLIISLFLSGCDSSNQEQVMKEVKSTDLSNEKIDGIGLGMSLKDKRFAEQYGKFTALPDNNYYASKRNYDQYWNKDFIMSIDSETDEILQVGTLEDNTYSLTTKGIKKGDTINKVIDTYGRNYFKFQDKEQSFYEIGYVDHQHNVELSFTYFNDKVTYISLNYAFDRLKWKK